MVKIEDRITRLVGREQYSAVSVGVYHVPQSRMLRRKKNSVYSFERQNCAIRPACQRCTPVLLTFALKIYQQTVGLCFSCMSQMMATMP